MRPFHRRHAAGDLHRALDAGADRGFAWHFSRYERSLNRIA
jgi:hypothetical protein